MLDGPTDCPFESILLSTQLEHKCRSFETTRPVLLHLNKKIGFAQDDGHHANKGGKALNKGGKGGLGGNTGGIFGRDGRDVRDARDGRDSYAQVTFRGEMGSGQL